MAPRRFHFTVKVTGPITVKVTGFAVATLVLGLILVVLTRYGV